MYYNRKFNSKNPLRRNRTLDTRTITSTVGEFAYLDNNGTRERWRLCEPQPLIMKETQLLVDEKVYDFDGEVSEPIKVREEVAQ